MPFYLDQCHLSEPLTQFLQKRIDYCNMYHLLGARVDRFFKCICVCIVCIVCMRMYAVCMVCIGLLLAQASTGASTTSPKDPLLERHPAGPTQVIPGQVADQFFPPSETHPRTRFGAPARAALIGGAQSESRVPLGLLVAPIGPLRAVRGVHTVIPPQAPSELI